MGENESYWYESDAQRKASFSFDDADENVGSSMCGVSLEGTTKLFHELQRDAVNEDHPFLLTDNKYRIPLSKLVSQKSLNKLLESDNESDRTIITHLNIPPEEEVKILRRRIMDRWIAPDVNDTISRILLGRPFSLELYKSLEQKKSLLEAAVNLGDGDTILVITLYLLKTLKKSLFNQILMTNPVAANHYVNHLATRMQIQELTDLLTMLGRTKDASMKQFEMACRNPQRQIQRLNGCLQNHFIDPTSIDRQHIVKFIKLLEWQQGLKLANKNELSNEEMSVVDCLSYACENYWSEPQRSPCSPFTIAQDHNVNEKLLHWTVLTIRGKLKSWADIDEFLITEKWLGGRKSKTLLPMDQIVLQLHSLEAPSNILLSYLSLIDNLDDRLKIARTIGCHKAIIDIFVLQKDRLALLNCKAFLTPQTEEFTYAESKLNSSSIKWKN